MEVLLVELTSWEVLRVIKGPRNDFPAVIGERYNNFIMPKTPVLNHNIGFYLTGYTDGEGCFCVSFSLKKKLLSKLEIRPSFSVSQNSDRREVLDLFRRYFDCGSIRPDRSDKTLKFEVRSLKNLREKVIPHFIKYPLWSSKQKDFEKFSEVCQLMSQKVKRKTILTKIINIAYGMNSGIRKYNREQLLKLI